MSSAQPVPADSVAKNVRGPTSRVQGERRANRHLLIFFSAFFNQHLQASLTFQRAL